MEAHGHQHTMEQQANHLQEGEQKGTIYTCPMHPQIKQSSPGNCPICGMKLVEQKNVQKDQQHHAEMAKAEHVKILWAHYTITVLGIFLLTNPFTFEYNSMPMTYSDMISGALLIVFSFLSVNPFRLWAPWASCTVGIWLLFAPLVFWAPTAAVYVNDTIIGMLVISLAILVPGMPGMKMMMMTMDMDSSQEIPRGWSYNPSSWQQRSIVILLGWIGFFGSRYMAAYQLGYIKEIWDPFFGTGTREVLNSEVSKMWPISDAGLGAVVYSLEVLMGYMGGPDRWRTMPWMVTLFGILVIPLGATSIILMMLQPISVGAWCSMCLFTALAMLIMIPLTIDEVVAMIQFMIQKKKEGKPFWLVFWMGDNLEGSTKDKRSPSLLSPLYKLLPSMAWGVSVPVSLIIATALGVWLLFAPAQFNIQETLAGHYYIIGALVITFSIIAMAEVVRSVRFINILFAGWIIIVTLLASGTSSLVLWNSIITGTLLMGLSFPKGKIYESYGTYDPYIR